MAVSVEKVVFDNGGAFMEETRREVDTYLASGRTRLWGSLLLYAKAPVAIGLTATSWALLIFLRPSVVVAFLCLGGLVLGALLTAFCVQHDANHGSYFRHRRYNHLLGWTADALLGFSSYAWRFCRTPTTPRSRRSCGATAPNTESATPHSRPCAPLCAHTFFTSARWEGSG